MLTPANNGVFYLHSDHLGSTSVTTSDTGAVLARQSYTPYGSVRSGGSLPTDIGFTGQRAESGLGSLMHFNARMYSPYLNRWLQPDSIVPSAAPNGKNLPSLTTPLTVNFNEPEFLEAVGRENRLLRPAYPKGNAMKPLMDSDKKYPEYVSPHVDATDALNSSFAHEEKAEYPEEALGWYFQWDKETRERYPLPSGPLNPQALNRYTYVMGCPTRFKDPTGHSGIGDCVGLAIATLLLVEGSSIVGFGGFILMGGTITISTMTFGLAAPPSTPVFLVGVAMEALAVGGYVLVGTVMIPKTVECINSGGLPKGEGDVPDT